MKPNNSDWSPAELSEWAALFVAGALPPDEAAQFEARVASGDDRVVRALSELGVVAEALALAAPPIEPPSAVKQRLLERVAAGVRNQNTSTSYSSAPAVSGSGPQVWQRWDAKQFDQRLHVVRAGEGDWEDTGVPGVSVRKLLVDPERNQFTAMVRMAPGTAWPKHRHDGPEECLVLKGDLHVGDTVLREGDYQFAPPDSLHGIQRTDGGCLLLITSSLSDEHI